jgi:hypothetical protein
VVYGRYRPHSLRRRCRRSSLRRRYRQSSFPSWFAASVSCCSPRRSIRWRYADLDGLIPGVDLVLVAFALYSSCFVSPPCTGFGRCSRGGRPAPHLCTVAVQIRWPFTGRVSWLVGYGPSSPLSLQRWGWFSSSIAVVVGVPNQR